MKRLNMQKRPWLDTNSLTRRVGLKQSYAVSSRPPVVFYFNTFERFGQVSALVWQSRHLTNQQRQALCIHLGRLARSRRK